jgi:hypothetical protein
MAASVFDDPLREYPPPARVKIEALIFILAISEEVYLPMYSR